MKFLNIACGDIYIVSEKWVNCDFAPKSKDVSLLDLAKQLPYKDNFFDLIYCSHFIEHIDRKKSIGFIQECHRILKSGGSIRIVTPDFENIVKEYIKNLEKKDFLYAEFNMIELIDQCVRTISGGQLSKWYKDANESKDLANYIKTRTGHGVSSRIPRKSFKSFKNLSVKKVKIKIEYLFSRLVIIMLPRWFKENHISLTATGEKHLWIYDFNTLSTLLRNSGFKDISRHNCDSSRVLDFPFYPLDLDDKGASLKGDESMYIEATKI
jgi:predicted SAM-dependent methyltransferase